MSGRLSFLLTGFTSVASAFLLVVLIAMPAAALGGARVWVQVPFFELTALLLLLQIPVLWGERHSPARTPDMVDFWAAAFLLYALVRYFTAPVEYLARLEVLEIFCYAAIFWTARYRLARGSAGVGVLCGIVAVALAVALFSFWLHFHPGFLPWGETVSLSYFPRLTGPFGCPNHYGAFLYMATAAALALALFIPERPGLRLFFAAAAVVFMVGIAFSLSRGSWIGLFFVLLFVAVFAVRHARVPAFLPIGFLAVVLVVGLAWLAFSSAAQQRLTEVTTELSHDGGRHYVRIQIAADTLRIIRDSFWFGTGPATFVHIHPRYHDASYATLATYAHDDYLNLWSDYGTVGMVLGLGFVISVSLALSRRRASGNVPWTRRLILCAGIGAWAGMVVHSFFDFSLHLPACAALLFTMTGLGLRRRPLPEESLFGMTGPGHRFLLAAAPLVPLLLALCLIAGGVRTARGYFPWQQVEDRLNTIPFEPAVALLKKSAKADPTFSSAAGRLGDFYRAQASLQKTWAQRAEMGRQSIIWYQRALRADPLDDGLYMRLGMTYDLLGRREEAYLCYTRIIALQPFNGYFHVALAKHDLLWGAVPQAIAECRLAEACPFGGEGAAAARQRLEQWQRAKEKAPAH